MTHCPPEEALAPTQPSKAVATRLAESQPLRGDSSTTNS